MKVLIVDDDLVIQQLYSRLMQLADITAVVADNGSVVLDIALREKPDLILMDIMMPKLNGIEALRALKANEQTKNIPTIMLTAYEDEQLITDAMNLGAARYLVKNNFEPQEVIKIIQEVVASPAK